MTNSAKNDQIAKSLFSLIKYNAGQFKSESQAAYVLSQCEAGEYVTTSTVWGTTVLWRFSVTAEGIQQVTKHTTKQGTSIYWESGAEAIEASKKALKAKSMAKRSNRVSAFLDTLEAIQARVCTEAVASGDYSYMAKFCKAKEKAEARYKRYNGGL